MIKCLTDIQGICLNYALGRSDKEAKVTDLILNIINHSDQLTIKGLEHLNHTLHNEILNEHTNPRNIEHFRKKFIEIKEITDKQKKSEKLMRLLRELENDHFLYRAEEMLTNKTIAYDQQKFVDLYELGQNIIAENKRTIKEL